jgi:hypothetical protein
MLHILVTALALCASAAAAAAERAPEAALPGELRSADH